MVTFDDQIDDLRKWMSVCEMEPGAGLVLYRAPEVDGVRQEDFRDAQGFLHFSLILMRMESILHWLSLMGRGLL